MAKKVKKPLSIRQVDTLPRVAVLNEVVLNKADGYFYMGVDVKREGKKHGSRMEKTSV